MRVLILVPIIHTQQDMGSLLERTQKEYVVRHGAEKWDAHLKSIGLVWKGIRQMIAALELPGASVRLYQDGLPLCGREEAVVREVAAQGSQNHLILLDLMAQGAQIMGTEDPDLLLQEYRLHQETGNDGPSHENPVQRHDLLAARDQYIAGRINATLKAGEVGLLFLGMAHAVEPLLDANILVRHLLPSLREAQEKVRCPA